MEEAPEEFLETFGEFAIDCLFRGDERVFTGIGLFVRFLNVSEVVDNIVFVVNVLGLDFKRTSAALL